MKNWTITKKLIFLCSCFLVNIVVVQLVARWNSSALVHHIEEFSNNQLPAIRSMGLADMMHDNIRGIAYRAIFVGEAGDKEGQQETKAELIEASENLRKYIDEIESLNVAPSIKESIKIVRPAIEKYEAAAKELVALANSGKLVEAKQNIRLLQEAFEDLEGSLGGLGDQIEKAAELETQVAHEDEKAAQWIGLIILAISLVLGALNGWWIIRDIQVQLQAVMGKLRDEAALLGSTSTQVSVTSTNLSTASTRQAEALQQTASAIEEMSSMIKKTSENADESRSVAETSQQTAIKGQQTVSEMITAIQEINSSNEIIARQIAESNRQISEITKVINEIGNKTKVINEIVFQTKLLSFNASVEAARAGEHGKGFAVVAEEVGNLAQMSGNAAKEISDMLSASIQKVDSIVGKTKSEIERLMSQNKSKVDSGTRIAQDCGRILEEMVKSVQEVTDRVHAISSATNEQSVGVNEITKAMNQLDQITHANSATSREAQGASTELNNQATHLLELVKQLEALAGSGRSTGPQSSDSHLKVKLEAFGREPKDSTSAKHVKRLPRAS